MRIYISKDSRGGWYAGTYNPDHETLAELEERVRLEELVPSERLVAVTTVDDGRRANTAMALYAVEIVVEPSVKADWTWKP